jgi:hypothetical protein
MTRSKLGSKISPKNLTDFFFVVNHQNRSVFSQLILLAEPLITHPFAKASGSVDPNIRV